MTVDMGQVGEAFIAFRGTLTTLDQDLARAHSKVKGSFDKIEREAAAAGRDAGKALGTGLESGLGRLDDKLAGILGAFDTLRSGIVVGVAVGAATGLYNIVNALAEAGDQADQLNAALKSQLGIEDGYARLLQTAQALGVELEDVAGVVRRVGLAAGELGATNDEVFKLTETIFRLGRLGGSSAEEISGAATQLAQALAAGTLQGDELRSILENMPELAKALARSLGVSVGELRRMGSEGELTSERVFRGLLSAADDVQRRFAELPDTLASSAARLGNEWSALLATLDDVFNASGFVRNIREFLARDMRALRMALGGGTPQETRESTETRVREIETRRTDIQRQIEEARAAGEEFGPTMSGSGTATVTLTRELEALNQELATLQERLGTERLREFEEQMRAAAEAAGSIEPPTREDILGLPRPPVEDVGRFAEAARAARTTQLGNDQEAARGRQERARAEGERVARALASSRDRLAVLEARLAAQPEGAFAERQAGARTEARQAERETRGSEVLETRAFELSERLTAQFRLAEISDQRRLQESLRAVAGNPRERRRIEFDEETRRQSLELAPEARERFGSERRAIFEAEDATRGAEITAQLERQLVYERERGSLAGLVGRELQVQQALLEERSRLAEEGIEITSTEAQLRLETTQKIAEQNSTVETSLRLSEQQRDAEHELAVVRLEASNAGGPEEEARIARARALLELQRQGIDVTGQQAQAHADLAAQLARTQSEIEEARRIGDAFGQTFTTALEDVLFNFTSLEDAAVSFGQELAKLITRMLILQPLAQEISKGISGAILGGGGGAAPVASAQGNAFAAGRVLPFAKGGVVAEGVAVGAAITRRFATGGVLFEGVRLPDDMPGVRAFAVGAAISRGRVVDRPTTFPMAGGDRGLMGEAGPEAILPLTRIGGDLGVRAEIPPVRIELPALPQLQAPSLAGLSMPPIRVSLDMGAFDMPRLAPVVPPELEMLAGGGGPAWQDDDMTEAGGVTVQIIDQRSQRAPPIEQREERGANGEKILRLIVRDEVRRSMADGEFNAVFRHQFGVRTQPQGR